MGWRTYIELRQIALRPRMAPHFQAAQWNCRTWRCSRRGRATTLLLHLCFSVSTATSLHRQHHTHKNEPLASAQFPLLANRKRGSSWYVVARARRRDGSELGKRSLFSSPCFFFLLFARALCCRGCRLACEELCGDVGRCWTHWLVRSPRRTAFFFFSFFKNVPLVVHDPFWLFSTATEGECARR